MESAQGQRLDTHRSGLCLRRLQHQDDATGQGESMSESLPTMQFSRMLYTPAGANPFHHDSYSMGTQIGEFITIMHTNYAKDRFYIHDKRTGERIVVHLTELGAYQCRNPHTFVTVPPIGEPVTHEGDE